MTTFTNNNQSVSVDALFVDLTPEEAQNISGGWGFWKKVKKIVKDPTTKTVAKTTAKVIFGRPLP
ncbi:MAG: hypothetical protein AAGA83_06100 [Cyanobacteria bacterium P01_F01_bin.116]